MFHVCEDFRLDEFCIIAEYSIYVVDTVFRFIFSNVDNTATGYTYMYVVILLYHTYT